MSRSKWKQPIILDKLDKVMDRYAHIPKKFINKSLSVYSGSNFKKIKITRSKVGYKIGFFCSTTNYTKKAQSKKKILSKKNATK